MTGTAVRWSSDHSGEVIVVIAAGAFAGAAFAASLEHPALLIGLLGVAVVAACVQWPVVGLFLIVATSSTYAFDVGEKDLGMQSLRLPFVVLLLLICVLSRRPGDPPLVAIPRALLLVGAYIALLLASVFWATDSEPVLAGVVSTLKVLLMVVAVIALIPDLGSLRFAVWALISAGAVLAAISVMQHLTGTFDQTYLGFAKAPVRNIIGELEAPRVAGPIGDPNSFAQMMVVLVPLALERCLHERRRLLRVGAGVAALLCGVTTVLTFSRGGVVTLLAVLALFLVRHPPRLRYVLAVGAILLLIVPSVPPAYTQRLSTIGSSAIGSTTSSDGAIRGRATQMKIAINMFKDHPLVGVGHGNYLVHFPEYNRKYGLPPQLGQAPHNLYLEIASELGLAGVAIWLVIVVSAFRGLAALTKQPAAPREEIEGLAGGVRLALVALLISSVFLHGSYPIAFWLLVAISLAAGQIRPAAENARKAAVGARGLAPIPGG